MHVTACIVLKISWKDTRFACDVPVIVNVDGESTASELKMWADTPSWLRNLKERIREADTTVYIEIESNYKYYIENRIKINNFILRTITDIHFNVETSFIAEKKNVRFELPLFYMQSTTLIHSMLSLRFQYLLNVH